jgi:predicted ATPase
VVMLTGEPGIGKSHIALALQERLEAEPHITVREFCSAHHSNSALYPMIANLERAARFERGDTATEKFAKLEALLLRSGADVDRVVPALANLLSLPLSDRYGLPELSPQKRKEMTLAAFLAQLDALAARQPVFIAEAGCQVRALVCAHHPGWIASDQSPMAPKICPGGYCHELPPHSPCPVEKEKWEIA